MEPQNNEILNFLLNSINAFAESASNLEEDVLGQIVTLIDATYQTKDNKERREKDEMLNQARRSMDWKKYVLSLFQIIYFSESLNSISVEHILHEVGQFIRKEKGIGAINTEEFLVLIAANMCCLINRDFSTKIKKVYLLNTIEHLFDYDVDQKEEIKLSLSQYCFSCLGNATPMQAMGYTLLLHQLIFQNHFDTMPLEQAEFYLNEVSKTGLSILGNDNLLSNSPSDLMCIFEILNSHSEICIHLLEVVLKKIPIMDDPRRGIRKEDQNCHNSPIFVTSALYVQIIGFMEKLLNINVTQENITLLSFSSDAKVNTILNKTKKNAVYTLDSLMSYVFGIKTIHKDRLTEGEMEVIDGFTKRFEEHLKYFLTQLHDVTIVLFSINTQLSYEQSDLVYSVLRLLNEMILQYEYYSLFMDNRTEVIVNIILNLLLTTKRDHLSLQQNSKDFAEAEEKLINGREGEDMRSSAAEFLYNYCQRIDGTLSWITIFILKGIHMTLGQEGDYQDFVAFEQSLFFAKADQVNRIETGILGLLILSELIIQRKDLIEHINSFLGSDFNQLLHVESMIVRSRLCLFMKELISKLFRNNIEHFTFALRFLFECLIDYRHSVVSLQALNSIRELVKSPVDAERVEEVMFDLVTYLEKIINHASDAPYFDLLMDFFEKYPKQLSRNSANYVKFLVLRVLKEFNSLKNIGTNMIIDKCLRAICMIVSVKEVMDEKYISFEEDLVGLFSLLEHIQQMEFFDHFLMIATEIMKQLPGYSPIYSILQKNLFSILNKNEDVIDTYFFGLFYYWAKNGNEWITSQNPNLLYDMVKICLNSIESFPIQTLGREYDHFSQACVCLQMLIQFFNRDQLAPCINTIFSQLDRVEKKLVSDKMREIGFRFYQIYYCLVYYYPTETLRHLTNFTEKELLRVLVQDVPKNYLKFFRDDSMSRKIISVGLMSLFNNRSSTCHIPGLAQACFKSLIQVLHYVPQEQLKNKNQIQPKPVEEQKVEEYDNEFDEADRHPVPIDLTSDEVLDMPLTPLSFSNNKVISRLRKFEMPIAKVEEYQLFSVIYNQFKQNNVEFNNIMMDLLDSEMQNSLNTILTTKNVVGMADGQAPKTVVRKQMVVGRRADPSKILQNKNLTEGMQILLQNTSNSLNNNGTNNMLTE